MSTCVTCQGLDCQQLPDDQSLYSLDRELFPFIISCPDGQSCTEGNRVTFTCCGQTIVAVFPPGSSQARRREILQDAIDRCAIAEAFCGELNPPPTTTPGTPPQQPPTPPVQRFFYNGRIEISLSCPDGGVYHYVLEAGTFAARTQEEADRLANEFALADSVRSKFCVVIPGLCPCLGESANYSAKITGAGQTPFSAAASSGKYPTGMTISTSGRTVRFRGTPQTPGTYNFTLNVRDKTGSYWTGSAALRVLLIGYSTTTTGSFVVPAVSATATVDFSDVSDLTVGDTLTLAITTSGIVTRETGTFEVTNIAGNTVTLENQTGTAGVTVPSGSTAAWAIGDLPEYTTGVAYSFQLPATGGSGSYSWKVATGSLPTGLTMSITGLIEGTPTGTGDFAFTVELVDNACEIADETFFVPVVRFSVASVSTTSVIRGFDEFGTASVPPKRYMTRTWNGNISGNDASGLPAITGEAMSMMFIAGLSGDTGGNPPASVSIPIWGTNYVPLATSHVIISGVDQINARGQTISTASIQLYSSCPGATPVIGNITDWAAKTIGRFVVPGWNYKYDLSFSFEDLPSPTWPTCETPSYPLLPDNGFTPFQSNASLPYPLYKSSPSTTTTTSISLIVDGSELVTVQTLEGFLRGIIDFPNHLAQFSLAGGAIDPSFPHIPTTASGVFLYKHSYSVVLTDEYTDAIALAHAHVVNSNSPTAVNKPRTTGFVSYSTTVTFTLRFTGLVNGQNYTATVTYRDQAFALTTETYQFTASGTTHSITDTVPTPASGGTRTIISATVIYTPT